MSLSRRNFLFTAGAAAFATPLDALRSRVEAGFAPPAELGYGPLRPVKDATTGLPLLELPEGFRYLTFGWTGDPMDDGRRVPPLHDGMAAFAGPNGQVVLVRNHEIATRPGIVGVRVRCASRRRHDHDHLRSGGRTRHQHPCQPCRHDPKLRRWSNAVGVLADVRGECRGPDGCEGRCSPSARVRVRGPA